MISVLFRLYKSKIFADVLGLLGFRDSIRPLKNSIFYRSNTVVGLKEAIPVQVIYVKLCEVQELTL